MTAVFARESLASVKPEMLTLLDDHWREVELNQDKIKLSPHWEAYAHLDSIGALHIYTARTDGELAGYLVFFVSQAIHHVEHLLAMGDVIYIRPESRACFYGLKLIQYAESELKKANVSFVTITSKVDTPIDSIAERAGYKNTERVLTKYIGD